MVLLKYHTDISLEVRFLGLTRDLLSDVLVLKHIQNRKKRRLLSLYAISTYYGTWAIFIATMKCSWINLVKYIFEKANP